MEDMLQRKIRLKSTRHTHSLSLQVLVCSINRICTNSQSPFSPSISLSLLHSLPFPLFPIFILQNSTMVSPLILPLISNFPYSMISLRPSYFFFSPIVYFHASSVPPNQPHRPCRYINLPIKAHLTPSKSLPIKILHHPSPLFFMRMKCSLTSVT